MAQVKGRRISRDGYLRLKVSDVFIKALRYERHEALDPFHAFHTAACHFTSTNNQQTALNSTYIFYSITFAHLC